MNSIKILEELGNILAEYSCKGSEDIFREKIIELYLKGYMERGYYLCGCCQTFYKLEKLTTRTDAVTDLAITICEDCNRLTSTEDSEVIAC